MNMPLDPELAAAQRIAPAGFELRFPSLFQAGRALAFPCDATGRVDLDTLSERARCNYFCARTAVGRDYAMPSVQCSATVTRH